MQHLLGIRPPKSDSSMPHANNGADALGPRIKLPMAESTANKLGSFLFVNIQIDQAIGGVRQSAPEKTMVENSPASQELVLVVGNVFIKNNHGLRDFREEARLDSSNASPASCTASAIASRDTVPRH
jgi:hypothetical protein